MLLWDNPYQPDLEQAPQEVGHEQVAYSVADQHQEFASSGTKVSPWDGARFSSRALPQVSHRFQRAARRSKNAWSLSLDSPEELPEVSVYHCWRVHVRPAARERACMQPVCLCSNDKPVFNCFAVPRAVCMRRVCILASGAGLFCVSQSGIRLVSVVSLWQAYDCMPGMRKPCQFPKVWKHLTLMPIGQQLKAFLLYSFRYGSHGNASHK